MLSILPYIGKVLVYSGIFAVYYWFAMRKGRFIGWNRWYLIVAMVLSVLLPLLHFPIHVATSEFIEALAPLYVGAEVDVSGISLPSGIWMLLVDVLLIIYLLVACTLLAVAIRAFWQIGRLKKTCTSTPIAGNIKLYSYADSIAPFSFFRNIFLPSSLAPDSIEGQKVLTHEMEHVLAKHSFDKLTAQLVCIVFWFNPFFWFFRKELSMVHEFLADKASVKQGGVEELSRLILCTLYPQQHVYFGNQFLQSPIKRRLVMIANTNTKHSGLKKLLIVPVMILVACLFTVRLESKPQLDEKDMMAYDVVKVKPKFQGEDANTFATWVSSQVTYPKEAQEKGIQGRVILSFVIGKDGVLRDIKVLRGVDQSLDNEAIRVISLSPKWTPGKHRGKKVNVRYTFPINFSLTL